MNLLHILYDLGIPVFKIGVAQTFQATKGAMAAVRIYKNVQKISDATNLPRTLRRTMKFQNADILQVSSDGRIEVSLLSTISSLSMSS